MDGFLDILLKVGSDPWSWAVVAAFALVAAASLWRYLNCPIARGTVAAATEEEARRALDSRIRHPLSYLVLMLLGMGIAIAGLFGLSKQEEGGVLPFLLLTAGLFLIMTLPVRMRIKDAELRVVTARSPELRHVQTRTLRSEHRVLLEYEFGIPLLLGLTLILF